MFINHIIFKYFVDIDKNYNILTREKKNHSFNKIDIYHLSNIFKTYDEINKNDLKNTDYNNRNKLNFEKNVLKKKTIFTKLVKLFKYTFFNWNSFYSQVIVIIKDFFYSIFARSIIFFKKFLL